MARAERNNCRAFDSLAPASSPLELPVYVARRWPVPFRETPILDRRPKDTPHHISALLIERASLLNNHKWRVGRKRSQRQTS